MLLPPLPSRPDTSTPLNLLKVGTRNALLVGKVEDNGSVAKEARRVLLERAVGVDVLCAERVLGDVAVLAAQVADLAGLGLGGIAGGGLAALVRIEVSECGGAVAVGGDGRDVEMVDCRVLEWGLGYVYM